MGFALASGIFIAGPVTGGAVNPVRALGPMIVAGNFDGAWICLAAPILGGIATAFLYDRFVSNASHRRLEPPRQAPPFLYAPLIGRAL